MPRGFQFCEPKTEVEIVGPIRLSRPKKFPEKNPNQNVIDPNNDDMVAGQLPGRTIALLGSHPLGTIVGRLAAGDEMERMQLARAGSGGQRGPNLFDASKEEAIGTAPGRRTERDSITAARLGNRNAGLVVPSAMPAGMAWREGV